MGGGEVGWGGKEGWGDVVFGGHKTSELVSFTNTLASD